MYDEKILNDICVETINYFEGDAKRIQHFLKVHALAKLIGESEHLTDDCLFVLEGAAYVHDVGIKPAELLFGRCDGKLQEKYGPKEAQKILQACGVQGEQIERITYLVGHHHTYDCIDGVDYMILVEADFLVNFYEDGCDKQTIKKTLTKLFKTPTAIALCQKMFGV
jgi:hypothetical protein